MARPKHNATNDKRHIERLGRQKEALRLRAYGFSFQQIAGELDVGKTTAFKYYQDAITEARQENLALAESARDLELERCDIALRAIAAEVRSGNLAAIDRWIKIIERRSAILGIDASDRAKLGEAMSSMSAQMMLLEVVKAVSEALLDHPEAKQAVVLHLRQIEDRRDEWAFLPKSVEG